MTRCATGTAPDGVIVASEPSDNDPDWHRVPDDSVVEATTAGVTVRPIAAAMSQAGQLRPAGSASHPNGEAARP